MLDPAHQEILLDLAESAIRHGLDTHRPPPVGAEDYPEALRRPGASFLTLHRHGGLRGCIGTLKATRPLVEGVAHNAYAASFRDPRFSPLTAQELQGLDIHISILSPAGAMAFGSEEELLRQLRPGIDGLILQEGKHHGTFLPSVWESLPSPRQFLQHLKLKAGLLPDYWSDTLTIQRYSTESFSKIVKVD